MAITLTHDVGVSDPVLAVSAGISRSPSEPPLLITVDSEDMYIDSNACGSTSWPVIRGANGTSRAPHSSGATVITQVAVTGVVAVANGGFPGVGIKDADGNVIASITFAPDGGVGIEVTPGGVPTAWITMAPQGQIIIVASSATLFQNLILDREMGIRWSVSDPTRQTLYSSAEFGPAGSKINLPTADPAVAGAWWNDAGTVKVSAG